MGKHLVTGKAHVIGLISDTHGLLRPEVHAALAGVELILHAGDVGGQGILDELGTIAPTFAVFGNTDPLDGSLPEAIMREIDGVSVHVSHGHELGRLTPDRLLDRYPQNVLVYGHTHRQLLTRRGQRMAVNPGAAGARRFNLVPSVARLTISRKEVDVTFVELTE